MNKNMLLAFVLIAATVIFFNSSFWNHTVLRRPVPPPRDAQTAVAADDADTAASIAETSLRRPGDHDGLRESEDADGRRVTMTEAELAALTARIRDSLIRANVGGAAGDPSDLAARVDGLIDTHIDSLELSAARTPDTIIIETDRVIAAISTQGARIVSLKMKDYTYIVGPRKGEFIDVLPMGSVGGAQLTINNESFDEKFFTVINDDIIINNNAVNNNVANNIADDNVVNNNVNNNIADDNIVNNNIAADNVVNNIADDNAADNVINNNITNNFADDSRANNHIVIGDDDKYEIIFETTSSDGQTIQKIFTFENGTYMIGYGVRGDGLAGRGVTLGWEGGVDDTEAGVSGQPFGAGLDRRRAHYSDGRTVDHFEMKRRGVEEPSGMFRWVGMSSKYFFTAIAAEQVFDADLRVVGRDVTVRRSGERQSGDPDIDYSVAYRFEAESDAIASHIYAGPNRIDELSRHGLRFEKALFPVLSWARHIFWADAWFPPLAELILRVLEFFYGLVKDYGVAIFLLTLLSKLITFPLTQSSTRSMMRMRDLQPKIVALRNKYKGNPQKMNAEMMAMYKAEGVNPFNPGCLPMFLQMPIFIALFVVLRKAIELRGATTFLLPWVNDLSLPEAMFYLPGGGLPIYGNNVALMPIIMAAITFFQQKQTITDPNQKMIIYMMPILMLVMFNGFPAGVVFYWTVSSALGLIQQMWLKPKPLPLKTSAGSGMATVTSGGVTQSVPVKKKGPSGKRR